MYDPRFRLALLLSTIIAVITVFMCVRFYLYEGLNWPEYFTGIIKVGGSIGLGFFFVWSSVKLMTYERDDMKSFEPSFVDETGTGFNFPVSLSKFIPDVISRPFGLSLSPLEEELLGFLDGYRHWPYDVDDLDKGSLYDHAIIQWNAMSNIEGATPLHRAAALAQDLSAIYAYKEKRQSFHPLKEFWKQDKVSFSRRCVSHGGLSATILATMPAFRKLGHDDDSNQRFRRAILTAVRYRDNPTSIPANCDPLAKDIYEALHKSAQLALHAKAKQTGETLTPEADDIAQLEKEMRSYFQAIVRDLEINPSDIRTESDGVYLGNGHVAVRMSNLTKKISQYMSPQTRGKFNLWDVNGHQHPSWGFLLQTLYKVGVLVQEWDNTRPRSALFNLNIGAVPFNQSAILNIRIDMYPELRQMLDSYPKLTGIIETQKDGAAILEEIRTKSAQIDEMIAKVHDSVHGT